MPARICVVPSCGYRRHKNEEVRLGLFSAPKDESRFRQWQEHIPGLNAKDLVCERHFHPSLVSRYYDTASNSIRTRLKTTTGVPTIFCDYEPLDGIRYQTTIPSTSFYDNYANVSQNQMASTSAIGDLMNTSYGQNASDSIANLDISDQIHTKTTLLEDAVSDLTASESILMKIKQEELLADIKTENTEDYGERFKSEADCEIEELTVFEQIQINRENYARIIPELWNLNQLVVGTEDVMVFSKDCTISENRALLVMYEKTVVLSRSGSVHYSVHGSTLKCNDSTVEPYFPSQVKSIESLLNVITKFNEVKVCQGVCTSEFEVDKDCTVYQDDLGYCRHVNCTVIADTEQCNPCFEYSQYLAAITMNNVPVLDNEPVDVYNHQIY